MAVLFVGHGPEVSGAETRKVNNLKVVGILANYTLRFANETRSLMARAFLKLALRFAAVRLLVLIFFRHVHIGQRDTVAAMGAVVVIVSQSNDGNA